MDIIKKKNNFYYKKTRNKVYDKKMLKRLRSVRIPPAYNNIEMSSDKQNKIQAIGTDSKNRKQYFYNNDFIESQKKLKFGDLVFFGKKIKRIRRDINHNIDECSKDNKSLYDFNTIISVILYIIDRCNFRVGCNKYKELYKTYGVTTLNNCHFKFNNNNVEIEFVGKKGIVNKDKIKNKKICSILDTLSKNSNEYIFRYRDKNGDMYRVTEKHINKYLKKYHKAITVKMFRTWSSNYMLLRELIRFDIPKSNNEAKKNITLAIKKIAHNMHHTPSVSKKSYINNEIINIYLLEHNTKFYRMLDFFRKTNGDLPNIDRLLNLIIQKLN
jgi:DNA topoisomerase I